MRVNCPNCATVYNLPDNSAREGAKLRCTVCKHVFLLSGAQAPPEPRVHIPSPPEEEPGDTAFEDLLNVQAQANAAQEAASAGMAPDDQDDHSSLFDSVDNVSDQISLSGEAAPMVSEEEILGLGEGEDLSFDIDSAPRKSKKSKKKTRTASRGREKRKTSPALILLFLLLAGAGAAGFMYWDKIKEMVPFLSGQETVEEDAQPTPDEHQPGEPYLFSFSPDMNHMFVDNSQVGRLFVIQGSVVNDYDVPKDFITLEAQLLDAQGNVLDSKTERIGNTLSYYQLQVFAQEDLENTINLEAGIRRFNLNVAPGAEVPFVFVFYNPPEDQISEFVLRVVEASTTPPEYRN